MVPVGFFPAEFLGFVVGRKRWQLLDGPGEELALLVEQTVGHAPVGVLRGVVADFPELQLRVLRAAVFDLTIEQGVGLGFQVHRRLPVHIAEQGQERAAKQAEKHQAGAKTDGARDFTQANEGHSRLREWYGSSALHLRRRPCAASGPYALQ